MGCSKEGLVLFRPTVVQGCHSKIVLEGISSSQREAQFVQTFRKFK